MLVSRRQDAAANHMPAADQRSGRKTLPLKNCRAHKTCSRPRTAQKITREADKVGLNAWFFAISGEWQKRLKRCNEKQLSDFRRVRR
jgi:hypothetical protein